MAIVYNADGEAGKVCNKCGEWKPVIEFSRQTANLRKGGDGNRSKPDTIMPAYVAVCANLRLL